MKLTFAALLLVAFANAPAFASETKIIQGCEQYQPPGTNAWSKVDPSCNADTASGEDVVRPDEDDKED